MDRLKRERRPIRALITRKCNEVDVELGKEEPDLVELRVHLRRLQDSVLDLEGLDQKILDAMLDAECTDEEQDEEIQAIEEYKDKIARTKIKIEAVLSANVRSRSPSGSECSTAASGVDKKKNYKLPKIEIKKFNGELTEWLSFWSQFQKIHDDEDLHESDKFQYLVQSMMPGTRAKKLVESYPQSAENYQKVVDALKDRFGDKVILTEVYVRKLMKMVISNVAKAKENISLAGMYDDLESHLRALESLGVTTDQSAAFLYPLVESSLPLDVIKAWQRSSMSGYEDGAEDKPVQDRLKSLMKFVRREVKGSERLSYVTSGLEDNQKANRRVPLGEKKERIPTAAGLHAGDQLRCIFCDRQHESENCGKAQSMSLQEKKTVIGNKRCCYLCLKSGHISKTCKKFLKCLLCNKKHLALMCPDLPSHQSKESAGTVTGQIQTTNSNLSCSTTVILKTLMVCVVGKTKKKWVRVLLDDGSQRSYILKNLAEELDLQPVGTQDLVHALFTGVKTGTQRHLKYNAKLSHSDQTGQSYISVLDQEKICGHIPRVTSGPWTQELKQHGIWISDVGRKEQEISMLIGADAIGELLTGRIHRLTNGLTAVETVLGWSLMGQVKHNTDHQTVAMTVTSLFVNDASIQQLWDLDVIGIRDSPGIKSKEEKQELVKQSFLQTVSRNEDGRYAVKLPWISEGIQPPDNKSIAERRLLATTIKLRAAGKLEDYSKLFLDWEKEGIIEVVESAQRELAAHYLPHRPVFKPGSTTTPIRPVFDASCKCPRSPSLNECLEKGPNLLEVIPSILLRFREKKIGITSDIRKAFLMIEVNVEDRNYLRFLWLEDPDQKTLKVYRHRRVVFGVNCSPFLLAAVIEHHLSQVQDDGDRQVAQTLLRSLYVDNCVTSLDTVEECSLFKERATRIMADARMELRQWECGGSEEVAGIGQLTGSWCGLDASSSYSLQDAHSSVLGLNWNKEDDTLSCDLPTCTLPEKITKRVILSFAQKIFDPLGLVCPVTLKPKMLLQTLWAQKTGWDEEVDEGISSRFAAWVQELSCLREVKIPRNETGNNSERSQWQFHTFSDASKNAYAAVVFLRTDDRQCVSVQLLQAKARVAPVEKTTIPRLELLGCTIAARLAASVKLALGIEEIPCYFWSDSSTALAWIRRNDEWGTFVGNRVREILKLTKDHEWKFVPGVLNPADLPSRGCSPKQMLESKWWEGPDWLAKPEADWPSSEENADENQVSTERRAKTTIGMTTTESSTNSWYAQGSSYIQNVRVLAWVRRFAYNSRPRIGSRQDSRRIELKEFKEAERHLLRLVQAEVFPSDVDIIKGIRVMKAEDGLIRVKTKLVNREDTCGFRYPILLPHNHCVVQQIIREEHQSNLHAGVQFIMGSLRERFWILQGRKTVRSVIQKCVRCRRFTTPKVEVVPAPLPADRVDTAKVFEITGVDLAGPLFLKKEKVWIVLFTCAVYRCLHLELVKAISTEAFLEAVSRFTSRRGRPATIYSDNGTNFVGTDNAFRKLNWEKIGRQCGIRRIEWKFNPPTAAWWGGWWERLVRSIKDLLRRVLGRRVLTYDRMKTYLCEIESVINGRPLTTVTEDPEDLIPLTPAMFLHELPTPEVKDLDLLDPSGFQRLLLERKTVLDEFKMRFRKEYLALLVQREKEKKYKEFKVGDVVLVGSDDKRRWEWPMARIEELMPGQDGCVRVARVKTQNGTLLRPIQRLFSLEVSSPAKIPNMGTCTRSGRVVKSPQRLLFEK